MDVSRAAALTDERMAAFRAEVDVPSVAYGLVKDGVLVHASGVGALVDGRVPGPDDVFRIASMTKSFTASAVLLLRDRGMLRLDDELSTYLPWTAGLVPAGAGPGIRIGDLLSMKAGFPTDDPWGDRHESLAIVDFDALVERGITFARAPRTGYEYSNLGYALLGRVVTVVSGTDYRDVVHAELLDPLGLAATRYDARAVPADLLVQGYAPTDGGLVAEPLTAPGAFSPMGGLHSSVRDLATWVGGFQSSWTGAVAHPLDHWSRREMQEPHSSISAAVLPASDDVPERVVSASYGYGLVVEDDARLGRVASHSGGYPGFGSHMRWHPASGWGVIALGNRTYFPAHRICGPVLASIVEAHRGENPVDALASVWSRTREAMAVVESLVESWDDATADRWFAPNMDLDRPRAERRAAAQGVRSRIGAFTRAATPTVSSTPAMARWWLEGSEGTAYAEVLLSPDREPLIQALTVSTDPVPDTTSD
jgi:CubicO group peptidase (beta-lactamase class C family)